MPATTKKKLNIFQRAAQSISRFRKKHPYWFMFIVGALSVLPVAAALGVIIFAPVAAPAFLAGGVALASHFGLSISIPAFVAAAVSAAAVIGGLFAAVRKGFGSLFMRAPKPMVAKKPTEEGPAFVQEKTDERPAPPKKTMQPKLSDLPKTPSSGSRSGSASHSQENIFTTRNPAPSPTGSQGSSPSGLALVTAGSSEGQSSSTSRSSLLLFKPVKSAEECYEEATKKNEMREASVKNHFDKALKLVAELPDGDFSYNAEKFKTTDRIKQMKTAFGQGELASTSGWDTLPPILRQNLATVTQVGEIEEELSAARKILESPKHEKYANSLNVIARIDSFRVVEEQSITEFLADNRPEREKRIKAVRAEARERLLQEYATYLPAKETLPPAEDKSHSRSNSFG